MHPGTAAGQSAVFIDDDGADAAGIGKRQPQQNSLVILTPATDAGPLRHMFVLYNVMIFNVD